MEGEGKEVTYTLNREHYKLRNHTSYQDQLSQQTETRENHQLSDPAAKKTTPIINKKFHLTVLHVEHVPRLPLAFITWVRFFKAWIR